MQIRTLKKSLIAVAAMAAAGVAFADSGVSLSGIIDMGLKKTTNTDSTKNKSEFVNNNTSTSLLYFKGFKDLPNGLRVSFLLESDYNPAQGSTANGSASSNAFTGTPFNGEEYLALTGGFGDIKLGVPNAAMLTAGTPATPVGTQLGSAYNGNFGRLGTTAISGVNQFDGNATGRVIRHEKSAIYTTPSFAGFKAGVEVALGNSNSTAQANNTNAARTLSLQYNVGPVNAIYVHSNEKAGSIGAAGATSAFGTVAAVALPAGTDVSWNFLAANYKFGDATVMGGFSTTKHNATTVLEDSKSWNIAGKYLVSPQIELVGNYLVRNTNLSTAADAKMIALGVNYLFDASTNLYVRYEGQKFDAFGTTASTKQDIWAFGARYQF